MSLSEHKAWVERDRTKDNILSDACPCETCGCFGNQLCGHEPLTGFGCSLKLDLECNCCDELALHPKTAINPKQMEIS